MRIGMDAFCKHGQRMFSLGRHLNGRRERLVEMICAPVAGPDEAMTRLPRHRVRRFVLRRRGPMGRVYLFDGTPTTLVFNLDYDDPAALYWIGLPSLADGAEQWFDLAARPLDGADVPRPAPPGPFANHPQPRNALR
jgi:hypothetical protein